MGVTVKKGPHGILFKRAVIPNSNGTVQNELVVTTDHFFYRITNRKAVQIHANETGRIVLDNDREVDANLIYQTTFPGGVFPTNGPF